jgi:hypothetical protein
LARKADANWKIQYSGIQSIFVLSKVIKCLLLARLAWFFPVCSYPNWKAQGLACHIFQGLLNRYCLGKFCCLWLKTSIKEEEILAEL